MDKKITESEFRALCEKHGSPDDIPCDEMPESIAAALSGANRFFDEPETIDDAVEVLKGFGLLKK